MEQDAIEATIGETDVILVVFVKGVHGVLHWGEFLGAYPTERLSVLCLPPELRRGPFRTLLCGAKRTTWCWRRTPSRRPSRKRKLKAWPCKCDEPPSPSRPTSRKDFVGVGKRTKRAI